MKILLYARDFFPVIGGVQTSVDLLARGLVEYGAHGSGEGSARCDVTVVTQTPAEGMDDSVLSYRVIRRPGPWQLFRLIRAADVIHLAGPCLAPMAIAWAIRKPTVILHHGYQAVCPNGLLFEEPLKAVCPGHFMNRRYQKCVRCCSQGQGFFGAMGSLPLTFPRRWLSKRVAANAAVTDHLRKRLDLPRARTIYLGIPEANQSSLPDPTSPPSPLEFAYVGRLVSEKGLPLLLEAAKSLKDSGRVFRLTFIGDGPERGRLEEMRRQLGLEDCVVIAGSLRGQDLDRAVSRVAVLVMPSTWEETAGLSAIEQMMRGRAVIAADIGGLGEVVGDAGLKFAPGDWHGLAARIQDVMENAPLAESLGRRARARAMQLFSQHSMIHSYFSLYERALVNNGRKE